MMDSAPKRANKRINRVFVMILVLGVIISAAVYLFGQRISQSTRVLVQQDLAIYAQFQQLRHQLSEQERYLYQFYASFDARSYDSGFENALNAADGIILELQAHYGNIPPLERIINNQRQIQRLAESFRQNMDLQPSDGTDWDLAREQLSDITGAMRSVAPQIDALTAITANSVRASQQDVEAHLLTVNVFVVLYGVVTLTIAFLTGRAIKAYLASSAISERLSLFPQRTPNPIISLDSNNQVTYANPATRRLLTGLQRNASDVGSLLAEDLTTHQASANKNNASFTTFEYSLEDTEIRCELHWLEDQMQWDLHLTDITAQKNAERTLQFQAYHNAETGLDNQYKFREVLNDACVRTSTFTLGLIDIHSFNQVLTAYTLSQAQALVVETAAVIHKACHDISCDFELYQTGDSMFAVRMPEISDPKTVEALVKNIKLQVKLTQFTGQSQVELDFGFAAYPSHADDVESLIQHARVALETAARDDHLHYCFYDEALGDKVKRRQTLLSALRAAIRDSSFQLYFQPQLSLSDNRIVGAEVLIRWHRQEEWVSPAEFIPLAEQSGMIIPLGDWILNTACSKASQLVEQGYSEIVIAVNISPKQFSSPDFVDKVKAALRASRLAPKNLELEITEGVLFNQETDIIKTLHELKQVGVQLAIDDFGTGYSSLSYLKDFPIDKLKIDQSFVRNMHVDKADESIVRTIVDLGNNLNLTLIAEGVEEEEHVDILKGMGCDEIQGYWFSKPLDEGYFSYFLQSKKQEAIEA